MKINRIRPQDNNFLSIVTHIAKPPELLYFCGTLPADRRPAVAIVGTRKPTHYGREITERLAGELAEKGVIIVSGLALGVDGLAHRAAIEAGGITLAVLANGLNEVYPKAHTALATAIVERGGALLSEYQPTEPARPHYFLARNRIVSGLADAIIITEAAARSGTLNTAAHALEQGKDVFVVPGNITSPMSVGCNQLLRQGATPITSADDVLMTIAPHLLSVDARPTLGTTPAETVILDLLKSGLHDGDELQRAAGVSPTEFATTLTMLELRGAIHSHGANQWSL